ncbi:lpxtg-motif cell wall anchor domain-containing protein [Rutstroemia sp. NJR-2017a BVV2]|nr:lpxtg-motif cell wall anchor domain-containing protein [Rutstroemia sp. NJR-2017a BVV2]
MNPQSPRPLSLHTHRLDHNQSKLPRIRDAPQIITQNQTVRSTPTSSADSNNPPNTSQHAQANNLKLKSSSFDLNFTGSQSTIATPFTPTTQNKKEPFRSRLLHSFTGGPGRTNSSASRRTLSYPTPSAATTPSRIHETTPYSVALGKKARNVPVSGSKNGLNEESAKEMPSTMLSQGSYVSQTKNWVADQSHLDGTASQIPQSALENTPSRSAMAPMRGFRASKRMEPASSHESALMTLEGHNAQRESSDEQNSDDSDLFLKVAREEDLDQQKNHATPSSLDSRKSRIGMRQSLPAPSPSFRASMYLRRGSEQEGNSTSRASEEPEGPAQVLEYKPLARDRTSMPASTSNDKRSRLLTSSSLSNPTTPKVLGKRGASPEPQSPYAGRRQSVQEKTTTYRQSSLSNSYYVPRTTTYHSSPLVQRPMESNDTPDTHRTTEGTESSVSTTAPSTVWDELDDLKSRIHRLELTGKLPTTSGAAVSRASNERPPTATTTETTMSTSPKRGRGNSISPSEPAAVEPSRSENHPLLRSALAKSKPLLDPEIYSTLEATAMDALAIASMMGTSGQPGPISSSQSSVGGANSAVSDRQVRRKADSLCRSLTELCLALSERRLDSEPTLTSNVNRPNSHGREADVIQSIEPVSPRQATSNDLVKLKSSPRSFSRLEARRSSLLASSALPTLRFPPSETGTPTQGLTGGRRTSLLLRSRRAETEDPQETEEARFRAPSRAKTDLGRMRTFARDDASHPSLNDRIPRSPTISSSLALRRSYTSNLGANAAPLPSPLQTNPGRRYYERTPERETASIVVNSNVGGRRYLEPTPERETTTLAGRLAEERGQRKVSGGYSFAARARAGSIAKRTKEPLAPSQTGGYQ